MRRRMMVLAGVLAMTVSAAMPLQAAEAEPAGEKGGIFDAIISEDGLFDQLFGDDGLLEGKLPEKEDLEGMLQTLKEQLGKADSEIDRLAGSILEKAKEKYGSYDLDSLKEVLTPLLEKLLGDGVDLAGLGDLGSFDVGKGLEQSVMAIDLATAYTLERNADILEAGDAQIVDASNVYGDEIGLSEEFPYLAYVLQYNYTVDEENPQQLRYLCDGATLLLMTLHEEEDGSLTSLDTQVIEEEDIEAFLKDFCETVDKTPEDCQLTLDYAKASFPFAMEDYLEEHPEYTGIEYNGEVYTAEELIDVAADQLVVLYQPESESEAQ